MGAGRSAVGSRPEVTLLYEGWLAWDAPYGVPRVGGELIAAAEFVQRSAVRVVGPGASPGIEEQLGGHVYRVIAHVLDTTDAVVLDLGACRAVRWVRPDEGPGEFRTGTTVSLELGLGVNPWDQTPWTSRAARLHGTDHRWLVRRILRVSAGKDDATEVDEAGMNTVESTGQYCLLECSVMP